MWSIGGEENDRRVQMFTKRRGCVRKLTPSLLLRQRDGDAQLAHRKPLRTKRKDGTSLDPVLMGGRQKELSRPAQCAASALSRFERARGQLLGTSIPN